MAPGTIPGVENRPCEDGSELDALCGCERDRNRSRGVNYFPRIKSPAVEFGRAVWARSEDVESSIQLAPTVSGERTSARRLWIAAVNSAESSRTAKSRWRA